MSAADTNQKTVLRLAVALLAAAAAPRPAGRPCPFPMPRRASASTTYSSRAGTGSAVARRSCRAWRLHVDHLHHECQPGDSGDLPWLSRRIARHFFSCSLLVVRLSTRPTDKSAPFRLFRQVENVGSTSSGSADVQDNASISIRHAPAILDRVTVDAYNAEL